MPVPLPFGAPRPALRGEGGPERSEGPGAGPWQVRQTCKMTRRNPSGCAVLALRRRRHGNEPVASAEGAPPPVPNPKNPTPAGVADTALNSLALLKFPVILSEDGGRV